jgi:DNA-binding MarR family transcriptional regulator
MDWQDRLYRSLIAVADLVNRLDVDARLLAAAGVKLDRALFPLLARVAMTPDINVAEMANIVGRDHSTVSRQVIRLEELGLIVRLPDPEDSRSRRLVLSAQGQEIMARIAEIRRQWMEAHFQSWRENDRDRLVHLIEKMVEGGDPG